MKTSVNSVLKRAALSAALFLRAWHMIDIDSQVKSLISSSCLVQLF